MIVVTFVGRISALKRRLVSISINSAIQFKVMVDRSRLHLATTIDDTDSSADDVIACNMLMTIVVPMNTVICNHR